jgi:hypothetical protein
MPKHFTFGCECLFSNFFIFAPKKAATNSKGFTAIRINILFFKISAHFVTVFLSVLQGKRPTNCTSLQKELNFIVTLPQI